MLLPLGLFSHGFQDLRAALIASQVTQAEFNRINTEIRRDLIQKRFAGENARQLAGSAQVACPKWNGLGLHPWNLLRKDLRIFEVIDFPAALVSVARTRGL